MISRRLPQLRQFPAAVLVAALVLGLSPSAHAQKAAPVVLKHTPPANAEREKEFVVRANIVAVAGAYLPTLYYRPQGENRFYSLPMLPVPGSLNIYAASVPGIFVTKDLEYYLESYDTQLRGPAQAGSQKAPIMVSVVDPEVPPSQVVIRSDPPEAELFVDGKKVGATTWLGILAAGTHELLLKKDGYLEAVSNLDVPEGRDLDMRMSLTPAAEEAQFAVMSDPAGATVYIDDQKLGETPLLAKSPDGEHTLTVEKKGYARAERVMIFSKDRSIETTFSLQKLPPEPALAITTDPPNAKVFVDDKELGKTPFIGVVPAGEHTLLLKLEGRRTPQAQILMPEDRDLDLRFTLEEEKEARDPVLAVSSDPDGATVTLDDVEVGKSPYINVLPPGVHKIRLSYPGFFPYERKITMSQTNDVEVTLALIPEPPPPGPSKVTINSEQKGVEITMDGAPAGNTPLQLDMKPGQHVAIARKEGFLAVEERFTVVQGQSMQVRVALQPAQGKAEPILTVRSAPSKAKVTVDGKEVGVTPYSQIQTPGKHKLVVESEGYKLHEETFELPEEAFELSFPIVLQALRKTVQLQSASEAKKAQSEPVKEVIVAPEAVRSGARVASKVTKSTSVMSDEIVADMRRRDLFERRVMARALKAQRAVSRPQVGPIVLAGTGLAFLGGAIPFGIAAMNTNAKLAVPGDVRNDNGIQLVAKHTTQVQATLGLAAMGVALAAGGAIWAALPKQFNLDADGSLTEAGEKANPPRKDEAPAKQEKAPAPAPAAPAAAAAGGGSDEPWQLGFGPTAGGAAVSVSGTF